jgi:hypothetical protein
MVDIKCSVEGREFHHTSSLCRQSESRRWADGTTPCDPDADGGLKRQWCWSTTYLFILVSLVHTKVLPKERFLYPSDIRRITVFLYVQRTPMWRDIDNISITVASGHRLRPGSQGVVPSAHLRLSFLRRGAEPLWLFYWTYVWSLGQQTS